MVRVLLKDLAESCPGESRSLAGPVPATLRGDIGVSEAR